MTSRASRPSYGIDAGGSGSTVHAWDGQSWRAPRINPSSVSQDESDRHLAELFDRIRAHAASPQAAVSLAARAAVWLASAAVDPATAGHESRRCAAAARAVGLHAEFVLSNDFTPLLLTTLAGVGHVITVCGTGSGFLATDGRSAPVRVGGCEYLGSDEGSGFDLGLYGLRAAVRGLDGRGPGTVLSEVLAAHAGMPVPDLARQLAHAPFPKTGVAALAPFVLRAWLDGDQVAAGVVEDAVGELVTGIRTARDAAAVPPRWRLSVLGGLMTGSPELFARLAAEASRLGAAEVELIREPAACVLAALNSVVGADPVRLSDPRIKHDVWHLDVPERQSEAGSGAAERNELRRADQWTLSSATSSSAGSTTIWSRRAPRCICGTCASSSAPPGTGSPG